MVDIVATDEFRVWYIELDEDTAEDVTASVDYLAVEGLRLGYPRSSAIAGTSFALRELRIQSKGHPRILRVRPGAQCRLDHRWRQDG